MTDKDQPQQDAPDDEILDGTSESAEETGDDGDKSEILERIPVVSAAAELDDAAEKRRGKTPLSKVGLLALLLALVALGSSGYAAWQQFEQRQVLLKLDQVTQGHTGQARALEASASSQQQAMQGKIRQLEGRLSELSSALEEANTVVGSHSRRLLQLTATTTDDWRLAEVEYLLRLANQRLLTSQDVASAASLLRASDTILLELDDPRLYPVRAAIASDSAALAALGAHDPEGAFLAMSAVTAQIDTLPLIDVPVFTTTDTTSAVTQSAEVADTATLLDRAKRILSSSWQSLRAWVVIQQRGEQVKPLLPPEQQYYLRNNLRLMLGQAQLALLDGRQKAYRDSIHNALGWLAEYFPADAAAVQAVVDQLTALQAIDVELQVPDISASLLAIKAVIEEQHRLAVGAGKAAPARSVPTDTGAANNAAGAAS